MIYNNGLVLSALLFPICAADEMEGGELRKRLASAVRLICLHLSHKIWERALGSFETDKYLMDHARLYFICCLCPRLFGMWSINQLIFGQLCFCFSDRIDVHVLLGSKLCLIPGASLQLRLFQLTQTSGRMWQEVLIPRTDLFHLSITCVQKLRNTLMYVNYASLIPRDQNLTITSGWYFAKVEATIHLNLVWGGTESRPRGTQKHFL